MNATTSNITAKNRINETVFINIGLSLNDALRMFVNQAVLCRGLPLVTREADMLYAQPNPQLSESQTRELLELLNDPEACQRVNNSRLKSKALLSPAKAGST